MVSSARRRRGGVRGMQDLNPPCCISAGPTWGADDGECDKTRVINKDKNHFVAPTVEGSNITLRSLYSRKNAKQKARVPRPSPTPLRSVFAAPFSYPAALSKLAREKCVAYAMLNTPQGMMDVTGDA